MTNWQTKQIRNLGRVVTGKTPPKIEPHYFDGDELFVSPKDLDWDQLYVTETETRVSSKALDKFKNQVIPKNSVMFTSLSFGFGKMGIASRALLTNQQINSVVVNKENNFRFVYYLLKACTPFIFAYNSGIDTPIVPKSVFERIELRFPEFRLQSKIAAVLWAYDELIQNNKRRIALLERLAEEIYREWFVRFRFPGHEKVKLVKGVPDGWEMVKTEKAFKFTGGGTPSKEVDRYWKDGDVNWFTPSDVTAAHGIFLERSGDRCTEEGVARSSATMFPPYSVMMTSRATIGALGINLTPACTNQGFITCIPNSRYPLPLLYHWLKLSKPHFELLAGGATFAELTKGTFKKIEILTPPVPIVAEFARIESPIFGAIETHLGENGKLVETRDRLLPRLISGKLSVENRDIQFPPGMAEDLKAEPTATVHA